MCGEDNAVPCLRSSGRLEETWRFWKSSWRRWTWINKRKEVSNGGRLCAFAVYQHEVGHMSTCLESGLATNMDRRWVPVATHHGLRIDPEHYPLSRSNSKEPSGQLGFGLGVFNAKYLAMLNMKVPTEPRQPT